MNFGFNIKSGNTKVGKIPVSTSPKATCPSSCPLKDEACYARFSTLGMYWSKLSKGLTGESWSNFINNVKLIKSGQLWRHNQAGDLPKDETLSTDSVDRLDEKKCLELVSASSHTKGFTYTHYSCRDEHNKKIIKQMNSMPGMTVNISADTLEQADEYASFNIGPVCVTMPEGTPLKNNRTPSGNFIVICPAQTNDNITCEKCKLCQVKTRKSIVGFIAHGSGRKILSKRLTNE